MARNIPGYKRSGNIRNTPEYRNRRKSTERSGPGYDTDRSDSRYKFEITLDFKPYYSDLSYVRKQINQLQGEVNKMFNSGTYGNVANRAGNNLAVSITKKSTINLDFDNFIIKPLIDNANIISDASSDLAQDIGDIGVDNIRQGIRRPENPPLTFRYDTGTMYNSVNSKVRRSKAETRIEIGWTRKFYKYFDYQERGTQQVGAMNAILNGYRKTGPQAYDLMRRFLQNSTKKSGFSGRYRR